MHARRPRPILYATMGVGYGLTALFAHEVSCVVPKLCAATYIGAAVALILAIMGYHIGHRERALLNVTVRDPLTGLFNRRYFEQRLQDELTRERRYDVPLTLALIDVDDMKRINTEGGHPGGDAALRCLADVVLRNTRASDACCRIGGDEFALVLTHTASEEAQHLVERLQKAFAEDPTAKRIGLGVSIGLAQATAEHRTTAELVAAADRALYVAKANGRNRVEIDGASRASVLEPAAV